MSKAPRALIAAILFASCVVPPLAAADNGNAVTSPYTLGDQTLAINAGLFLPLFMLPSGVVLLTGNPAQLTPGAVGSLSWAAYVTPQIRVGLDVAGNFTLSPNSNVLLMLPFVAKASYIFTFYPFEVPLTLGLGANIVKYTTLSALDFLVRPGAALYWIYNSSWSFGANLNWWLDMQFNTDPSNTRYGNFLEFSLSALYHF